MSVSTLDSWCVQSSARLPGALLFVTCGGFELLENERKPSCSSLSRLGVVICDPLRASPHTLVLIGDKMLNGDIFGVCGFGSYDEVKEGVACVPRSSPSHVALSVKKKPVQRDPASDCHLCWSVSAGEVGWCQRARHVAGEAEVGEREGSGVELVKSGQNVG